MINNTLTRSILSKSRKVPRKLIHHQKPCRANSKYCSVSDRGSEMYKKFDLPDKLVGSDKNVWVEYIQLVNQYKPINLGQGFPDYFPPQHLVTALEETCKSKDSLLHQYARSSGHPRLVNAISKIYSPLVHKEINPLTEVMIGVGATEILFASFLGHLQPGDEAIVIEPFFDCYHPMIKVAGGKPVFIPLRLKSKNKDASTTTNWVLDRDELSRCFNSKTKMIIVNTPQNPIGKVYSREELTFIAELCKKWNVLCLADEVYEWMIYEPAQHVRMASLPGMWERTITVGSAGKSFSVTGWKIGWAYGPSQLIRNLNVVHQNCVYTCASVLQEAIAIAMEKDLRVFGTPECYFEQIKAELKPKRERLLSMLQDMGMKPIIPEGGYFVVADWTPLLPKIDLSQEKDEEKDYKFTKWMTKNVGVLAIPPSAFYSKEHKSLGENYARFCFIKQDHILDEAGERMRKWKKSVK